MIIGMDGNDANVHEQVGVSVYTRNLLEYFQKIGNKNAQFRIFLRAQPLDLLPKPTNYFSYHVIKAPAMWSQVFLPIHLYLRTKIDVFFSPAHYSPRFSPVPTVVTIHDLAYEYYPQEFLKKDLYKLKNWTRYSVDKARKVIAVSKTTKKDLVKLYNVPEEKIEVVYNGFEKKINIESSNKYRVTTDTPYILYVGTLQPRKNINVLIQAFKKFLKNHSDYKLILVGKKGWMYERIFKEVGDLGLQKSVIFTGYLPDEDVVGLYKHAYCYVLPSLYEGFGIPLLEAMSHDCPVISSFAASLSEVGGDACIYFDPQNVDGLVDDLESLQKKDLRTDLIKKGREHIRLFSWEKCAKETLAILESVAQK